MAISNTSECEKCKFCILDDSDRAKILVTCERDGKTRYYGQYIDCDHKEEIKAEIKEEIECSEEE